MIYLLDTNAVIAVMKENQNVIAHIRQIGKSNLRICAPVEAELWFGVKKSEQQSKNRFRLQTFLEWIPSLPFESDAASHFGEIRADLTKKGTPIGLFDMQIAAIALTNDLTVVTNNTREFERVPNLKLEDWLI